MHGETVKLPLYVCFQFVITFLAWLSKVLPDW